jgi:uncharacterized membrane protein YfcA
MGIGLLMLGGGIVAGVFGSLLGLGGGILIVPLLTLGFGLPLREAVGVSLVCVIMTSGASAAVYLERDMANLRLGMVLELFTATGAVLGGAVAFLIDQHWLAGLFAALLLYVAWTMLRAARQPTAADLPAAGPAGVEPPASAGEGDPTAAVPFEPSVATLAPRGRADDVSAYGLGPTATFTDRLSRPGYRVRRLRLGAAIGVVAGVLSALLGIGGGIVKVPTMHLLMGVPLRVSTATSNLMVGITASTSAIVYLLRGGIDPYAAGPTAVGVFVGAAIGSRSLHRVDLRILRWLFVAVLLGTAFEMAQKAVGP